MVRGYLLGSPNEIAWQRSGPAQGIHALFERDRRPAMGNSDPT